MTFLPRMIPVYNVIATIMIFLLISGFARETILNGVNKFHQKIIFLSAEEKQKLLKTPKKKSSIGMMEQQKRAEQHDLNKND